MRDLNITKLSDGFGQHLIFIECTCGHSRRCKPQNTRKYCWLGRYTRFHSEAIALLEVRQEILQGSMRG
jgi:hypothetical protein